MSLGKAGKDGNWLLWVIIGIAALHFGGVINLGNLGGGQNPSDGDSGSGDVCIYDGATMTVGPMSKKFAPSTSVSSENARVLVNGIDKGSQSDGATLTVTPKRDKIKVLYGFGSSHSSNYYAAMQEEFKAPCAAAFSTADPEIDPNNKHALYEMDTTSGSNLVSIFNDENGNLNADSDEETIETGEVITADLEYQGNFEDAKSPYGKVLMTFKFNTTMIDDVKLQGENVEKVDTPTFRSNAAGETEHSLTTYAVPGVISNEKRDYQIVVDADDSTDPDDGADITGYIDDQTWFEHSKEDNTFKFAAEDDQDNDIGDTTDRTFTYYLD